MVRACSLIVALLGIAAIANAEVNARGALNRTLPEIKFNNIPLKDCIDFVRDVSGANIHVNWKAIEAAGVTPDTPINMRLRSVSLRKVLNLLLSESAGGQPTLTYYVDQGVIEITTRELSDKQLITIVYDVRDLLMDVPDFEGGDIGGMGNIGGTSGTGTGGTSGVGGGGGGGGWGGGMGGGGMGGGGGGAGGAGAAKTVDKAKLGQQLVDMIQELIQPSVWDKNGGPASIKFFNGNLIVTAPRSVHEAICSTGE